MKKKSLVILTIVILIAILILSLFIILNHLNKTESPQQVVENFYKYLDEKNVSKVQKYLIDEKKDYFNHTLENLVSIKIVNITESLISSNKDEYASNMKDGYIQQIQKYKEIELDPNNIKIFKVEESVKYKDDTKEPVASGNHELYYILTRKDTNSQWLIADWGF